MPRQQHRNAEPLNPRKVYIASDPVNAEIVKDYLAGRGVPAQVRDQYLWGGMGQLPANVYPTVWVDDGDDYNAARELIAAFEANATGGRPWRCGRCGEDLPGQFDTCWRCGAPRPEEP